MASLNKVLLIGNLTRDPEVRYLQSGTPVATFGLATSRAYTTQAGEKKEEVCFVRVVVWGRQAELCGEYLTKGRLVFVEGRLQYRSWEAEGQKRNTLEVRADRVQFLGPRPRGEASPEDAGESRFEGAVEVPEDAAAGTEAAAGERTEEVPF